MSCTCYCEMLMFHLRYPLIYVFTSINFIKRNVLPNGYQLAMKYHGETQKVKYSQLIFLIMMNNID